MEFLYCISTSIGKVSKKIMSKVKITSLENMYTTNSINGSKPSMYPKKYFYLKPK